MSTAILSAMLLVISADARSDNNPLRLPDMGESVDQYMSAEQEQQLGTAFMRNVRRSLPVIDDPQIARYIQSLGQRLATHSNQPQRRFRFFVVNNPNINAFAGPGGYIGVHSGLILAAQNEDELAAVLAHELAHVTQRHLARAYQSASNMSLPLTAAVIAAIILGGQANMGQVGEATLAAAAAGSAQQQINFTRSNEQEADRIGMQTLARSGYASDAMRRFFIRLQQADYYQEDSALEFLRSHPLTVSRIAGSDDPLATLQPEMKINQGQTPDQTLFQLMQARIRVLTMTDTGRLAAYFNKQNLKSDANDFGQALTAIRQRQYDKARDILSGLLGKSPDNLSYTLASIENELANGTTTRALAILKDSLHLYPNDPPLTVLYARTLLKDGQYDMAANMLRRYLRNVEPSPLLYSLLSEAEGKNDDPAAAHQAMAEYYFLNGDGPGALKQIQLALEQGRNLSKNDRLRLESRRQEIKQVVSDESGK